MNDLIKAKENLYNEFQFLSDRLDDDFKLLGVLSYRNDDKTLIEAVRKAINGKLKASQLIADKIKEINLKIQEIEAE